MALRLVRQTSDTPNITNKDDTVMTRYAYGGYNGVVKSFGNECSAIDENGILTLQAGRIVIDGWEIDIDGEGWKLDLSKITGVQYYSIYAEVSVITETAKIDSVYSVTAYPAIDKGNDLTQIQNGTARLLLYNVKVSYGIILETIKKFEVIPYTGTSIGGIKSDINSIKSDIDSIKSDIDSITDGTGTSIGGIKSDIDSIKSDIDDILYGQKTVSEATKSFSANVYKLTLTTLTDKMEWRIKFGAFESINNGIYFISYKKPNINIYETGVVLATTNFISLTSAGTKMAFTTSDGEGVYLVFNNTDFRIVSSVALEEITCFILRTVGE